MSCNSQLVFDTMLKKSYREEPAVPRHLREIGGRTYDRKFIGESMPYFS